MIRPSILAVICALTLAILAGARSASFAATITGDVNGDCHVNILDLRLVGQRYGSSLGSLLYSPTYDLNSDGQINIIDLQIVASQFGNTC